MSKKISSSSSSRSSISSTAIYPVKSEDNLFGLPDETGNRTGFRKTSKVFKTEKSTSCNKSELALELCSKPLDADIRTQVARTRLHRVTSESFKIY